MISVYYGSDPGYSFHKAQKDLKKKLSEEEYESIEKFDGYKNLLSEAVESLESLPLFANRKIVLFANAYFLTKGSNRRSPFSDSDQGNYKAFLSYMKNPIPESDLVLVLDGDLKKQGPLYEALLSQPSQVSFVSCSLPSDEEYEQLAFKEALEQKKQIDKDAVDLLLDRTRILALDPYHKGVDYLLFQNELNKLFCYKSHITRKDVEENVYKPLEDNVFNIVNTLVKRQTKDALSSYRELRERGYDPLSLLPAMASQLRNLALQKEVLESYPEDKTAAEELGKVLGRKVNPFSVKYRRRDVQGLSFEGFLQVMSDLSRMEKDIKINLDDADTRMELFLASFASTYLKKRW